MNAVAKPERTARHALRDVGASLLWALAATRPARGAAVLAAHDQRMNADALRAWIAPHLAD
jgi:hypothetical protein